MSDFSSVLAALLLLTVPLSALGGPPPDAEEGEARGFGINATGYSVETGVVGRGQTFSDLLTEHGVPYDRAVEIAQEADSVFNVRSIQAGKQFRVYMNPWLGQARYLVYQLDAIQYVRFDVRQPEQTRIESRPVQRRWVTVRGTIEQSLYRSLSENGAPNQLALRLGEMFAWQIDFFRVREGDAFRVLYEQRIVAGDTISPGPILAASFRHRGDMFYGFRFDDGNGPTYFDREGQSLQRSLLKAPLRFTRISSGYSQNRYHPILKEYQPHRGTDYAAPRGTPVRSVGSGTVQVAGYDGPNGNYVKVRHNGTYSSGYLHLADILVEPGEAVKQGETIGTVGSTGRSTGPHLDYRLWKRGRAVDPYELELPPTRPVDPQYRQEFERTVQDRLWRLEARSPVFAHPERAGDRVLRSPSS